MTQGLGHQQNFNHKVPPRDRVYMHIRERERENNKRRRQKHTRAHTNKQNNKSEKLQAKGQRKQQSNRNEFSRDALKWRSQLKINFFQLRMVWEEVQVLEYASRSLVEVVIAVTYYANTQYFFFLCGLSCLRRLFCSWDWRWIQCVTCQ